MIETKNQLLIVFINCVIQKHLIKFENSGKELRLFFLNCHDTLFAQQ